MEIILASNSPRRRELLSSRGVTFKVVPSDFNESEVFITSPKEYVKSLALNKALSVLKNNPLSVVIGADTVVVFNGQILGKPESEEHARKMLESLSNNEHEVITGYAVISKDKKIIDCEVTKVIFNELSSEFISSYVLSGSPMDKAGAYGIQDGGLAKEIFGDYDNVVGLPTEKIIKALTEFI